MLSAPAASYCEEATGTVVQSRPQIESHISQHCFACLCHTFIIFMLPSCMGCSDTCTFSFANESCQGHYPSLARVVNCWRASGNARKISNTWVELFGRSPSRLPPRALKGRWGSVDSLEGFLLQDCGSEQLPDVFEKATYGQRVCVCVVLLTCLRMRATHLFVVCGSQ